MHSYLRIWPWKLLWSCKKSWTREHDRKFTCDWTCVNLLRNSLKTLKSTHSQIKWHTIYTYFLNSWRIETLTKMESKSQTLLKYLTSSKWNTNFSLWTQMIFAVFPFFFENMKCFSGRKTVNYLLRVAWAEVGKVKALNKYCTRRNCRYVYSTFSGSYMAF